VLSRLPRLWYDEATSWLRGLAALNGELPVYFFRIDNPDPGNSEAPEGPILPGLFLCWLRGLDLNQSTFGL
jgi:hypothetical protein